MSRQSPTSAFDGARRDPSDTDALGWRTALSRRKVFKGAVGAAAAGAAAGAVLTDGGAAPALAAEGRTGLARRAVAAAQATTVEQGAVAPSVVVLADAATIALDASLGNDFRVMIAGNRALGNPASPTDGQKIILQITQGAGGSFAITWGSAYQFADGLPQPVLSTTAGQTDLLAFIYNAARNKWLLAAFVKGFDSVTITQPKGTYRLFPSTNGPSSAVSLHRAVHGRRAFQVTTGGVWFDGFWWWVCPSGQSTSPQQFALWNVYKTTGRGSDPPRHGDVGRADRGAVELRAAANPIPLAVGACYNASTGFSGDFPDTTDQFGAGDPTAAGSSTARCGFLGSGGVMPGYLVHESGIVQHGGLDPTPEHARRRHRSANFGSTSRSAPPRHRALPTGSGRTCRPCPVRFPRARSAIPWRRSSSCQRLHAGQHLVLLAEQAGSAADQMRDLGCGPRPSSPGPRTARRHGPGPPAVAGWSALTAA